MTPADRIRICKTCLNKGFDRNIGIICNISGDKPVFENECLDFKLDQKLAEELNKKIIESSNKSVPWFLKKNMVKIYQYLLTPIIVLFFFYFIGSVIVESKYSDFYYYPNAFSESNFGKGVSCADHMQYLKDELDRSDIENVGFLGAMSALSNYSKTQKYIQSYWLKQNQYLFYGLKYVMPVFCLLLYLIISKKIWQRLLKKQ